MSAAAKLANIKLGGGQQQQYKSSKTLQFNKLSFSTGSSNIQVVKPPVPSKPSHFDIANKFVESVQE